MDLALFGEGIGKDGIGDMRIVAIRPTSHFERR